MPAHRHHLPDPPRRQARRLRAAARMAAVLALGGTLACWAGATDAPAPQVEVRVVARLADGAGVAGVGIELRGWPNQADSARVYARGETDANGRASLGRVDGWELYRIFLAPPAGYVLAVGQDNPVTLGIPDGATVNVRLARAP